MKYLELIITFEQLEEGAQAYLSQKAINEFECLGVEELNLDFSKSELEDWQLQSAKEKIEQLPEDSQKLKFFYDSTNERYKEFLLFVDENFEVKAADVIEGNSEDWENEWKKHLQPIVVSENLKITFITDESEKKKIKNSELQIYPGMGFGTGGHETTFLCLQAMEGILSEKNIQSCLDYGCGSGILGILGAKRGIGKVSYYDIDEDALVNCVQNLKVNAIDYDSKSVTSTKKSLGDSYDLVMANILLHILILEKKDILTRARKDLVLSGILKNQEEEILEHYLKDNHFKLKE